MATKKLTTAASSPSTLNFSAFAEAAKANKASKPSTATVNREKLTTGDTIEGMLIETLTGSGKFGDWTAVAIEDENGNRREFWVSHEDLRVKLALIEDGSPVYIENLGQPNRAYVYLVLTTDDNGQMIEVERDFAS